MFVARRACLFIHVHASMLNICQEATHCRSAQLTYETQTAGRKQAGFDKTPPRDSMAAKAL
jgi:hypothetical protein